MASHVLRDELDGMRFILHNPFQVVDVVTEVLDLAHICCALVIRKNIEGLIR